MWAEGPVKHFSEQMIVERVRLAGMLRHFPHYERRLEQVHVVLSSEGETSQGKGIWPMLLASHPGKKIAAAER